MKVRRRLSTGPREAQLLTELERRGIPVLALARHRGELADFDERELRDLLYTLNAKGWLIRIERGKYLVVPRAARGGWTEHPFVIASGILAVDHYISYWSALSHHDLTEQLPRVVYVALRETQKRPIAFQGWRYQFVCRSEQTFFGFRREEFRALNGSTAVEVPIAEPEKAILDALDDELLAGGMAEVIRAVQRGLDAGILSPGRLAEYAHRYPSTAVVARLGYILQRFGVAQGQELAGLARKQGSPAWLSTKAPRTGARLDGRWHLLVNLPDEVFEPYAVR